MKLAHQHVQSRRILSVWNCLFFPIFRFGRKFYWFERDASITLGGLSNCRTDQEKSLSRLTTLLRGKRPKSLAERDGCWGGADLTYKVSGFC